MRLTNLPLVINAVTSGGATYNDSFMHGSINTVPFGGVGESGTGAYRGKASFDTFTHFRTLAQTPSWFEGGLRIRYQPYDWKQLSMMQWMGNKNPSFDRDGKVVRGAGYWLKVVLGLGTARAKGALLRWAVVALSWYYLTIGRAQ